MTTRAALDAPSPPSPRELRLVFAGLMMAMALASLDQNIVSTALPRIVSELGGLAHLSWTVTAFMLTSTATTPLYGKLSDMYGRKPLFIIAISIFLVGSALCGMAQSMTGLILFRALQGIGAGGLMTLAQTTIGDLIEPRERGRYQGLFMGTFAVCSVIGPLVGGVITAQFTWRWVFYVNLPIGALALLLIAIGLNRPHRIIRHRVDYPGAALLVAATSVILLVLSWGGAVYPWQSTPIVALAGAAVLLILLLIAQERQAAEPILPLRLFNSRVFSIGVAVGGLLMLAVFGALVFMPLFFQLVRGVGPAQAGLLMTPQIGGMIVTSVLGGAVISRTGRYKIMMAAGLAVTALGFAVLAALASSGAGGVVPFELCLAALGCGMGVAMPTLTVVVQNAVARADLGVATSAMSFLRSLGGALGVALAGGIMTARLHSLLPGAAADSLGHGIDELAALPAATRLIVMAAYQHAIAATFLAGALVSAIAFLVVLFLPEAPLASSESRGQDPRAFEH